MERREFLKTACAGALAGPAGNPPPLVDPATATEWLARWKENILHTAGDRYCDTETGEEIGWLMSPLLNGFYCGYRATHDTKWVEKLVDWTDSLGACPRILQLCGLGSNRVGT